MVSVKKYLGLDGIANRLPKISFRFSLIGYSKVAFVQLYCPVMEVPISAHAPTQHMRTSTSYTLQN
jgi:hypothetical protein